MSEQEVARVATPVTADELVEALESAWPEILGEEPDRETTLLLVAQSAFEDGWWRACWNFNLENAKHVDGDGLDFYYVACDEYLHGVLKKLEPPDPGCRFRAFGSLAEAVRNWIRLMAKQYPKALAAAKTHNPTSFCAELHAEKFYTDNIGHYTLEVVGCLAMVRKILAAVRAAPLPPNPDGERLLQLDADIAAGREGLPPPSTPPESA